MSCSAILGRIFTDGEIIEGWILTEGGMIRDVGSGIPPRADELLDFREGGNVIMPGFIDIHVHMRDLQLSYKEDFASGTKAAAKGGFTVVADMPNTVPKTNSHARLIEKDYVAKSKSLVDYGLYFGVPERMDELRDEVAELAVGIKVYMHEELYGDGEGHMAEEALRFAARLGLLVVAHAEDPKLFVHGDRPDAAECSAIRDIAGKALGMGFKLHITHLSSASGLGEVLKARSMVELSTDTCPHYLLLDRSHVGRLGGMAKVFPPLRNEVDRTALLRALASGIVDAVTSDHAPHSIEEKTAPFDEASPGFPGLETTIPLLLTLVNRGVLSLRQVAISCSRRPAEILGLGGIIGRIARGHVANLSVVNMKREARIDPIGFESKAKYSPFDGWSVKGIPIATIVRGRAVMVEGEVMDGAACGINVKTYHENIRAYS